MHIGEFCDRYGLDRRQVNYFTVIGVLHATKEPNGYYDYGPICEEEAKKLIIAQAMGQSRVEKYMNLFDNLPKELWDMVVFDKIKEEMEKATKQYRMALEYAREFKERQ